jgi:predicted DNA-binding transcriptional regulator YafY
MVLLRASSRSMDDVDPGPTGRLLALLSLLQGRPQWSGPELSERLAVTIRTVRRDVGRLRRLGYPVLADIGTTGGYRLGDGGRAMPPLMLDRDEALAVAVCLRSTATESIEGGGEAAIRALAKLEQLLPSALRRQVGAISTMTARLGSGSSPVDPEVLVTLTRACRDGERLRARYRDQRGRETERRLDPHRLVTTARRWYLVARDVDREAWRTLRVDRLLSVEATGHRVTIDDPPDPVALVQSAISTTAYRHQARVELAAPLADVEARVPPTTGILEAIDAERTMLTTGGDDLDLIVFHLLALDVDFVVHEPPALQAHIERVRHRLAQAVR